MPNVQQQQQQEHCFTSPTAHKLAAE